MKKLIALSLIAFSLGGSLRANEGMWLPILLNQNFEEMQEMGLKLSAQDIYDVNNGSLKDAIVSFGGFCTGEIISDQGLILTNHHCGYSAIQSHSSPENDYLSEGFWSSSLEEEIPNEGLYARFLVRMEDVTNQVLDSLSADMTEKERQEKAGQVGQMIAQQAKEGTDYTANVRSFYHGNEYYLFVYKTYNDVRLVGAPPESIGKFGGDTDNWMWPRHTGDFSLFRVYADGDNQPAKYAEDNVPFQPKHHLPVSLKGVDEGDFTMVMGFPGSTDRFLSSYGVKQAIQHYNPTVVNIRDKKLAIMKKYMDADKKTDIQYSSKYAQTANYWKYYIGQTEQLKENKVYDAKKAIEDRFAEWVAESPQRQEKYGKALKLLREGYAEKDGYVKSNVYAREAGLLGAELPLFAYRIDRIAGRYFATQEKMEKALDEAETDSAETAVQERFEPRLKSLKEGIRDYAQEFYGDYNAELDQELMGSLFAMYYSNIPEEQHPAFFAKAAKKNNEDFQRFAEKVFKKSFITDSASLADFLEKPKAKKLDKDPAIKIGRDLYNLYQNAGKDHSKNEHKLDKGYRLLTAGLREMNPDKIYSPDANSTMRVTYGKVASYEAKDAVHYDYYTTGEGILEKMDNSDPEFVVPDRLAQLLQDQDYGRYATDEGELPVCFIHNTDITGGNSGSPVINGSGELIGLAFDGNWEAMSGDIFFENEVQRTISVDIRYVLFVIDKFAQADRLLKEMDLVSQNTSDSDPASIEEDARRQKAEPDEE